MTFNANGLFTVTPGPEYKYCKILKAACKLRLDILLVQETHVNGLVDWHVRDVEQEALRYGYVVVWLHPKTFIKGGMMVLLKDDIQLESHGPVPPTSPFDERVLRLRILLVSRGTPHSHECTCAQPGGGHEALLGGARGLRADRGMPHGGTHEFASGLTGGSLRSGVVGK